MKRVLTISVLLLGLHSNAVLAQTRLSTPVDLLAKNTLKVYPNPATTSITFEFQRSSDKSLSIQIYNFMGKKMYESKNLSQHNSLVLNDFYRGIYIYQLRDKLGNIVQSGKFQIVK